MKNKLLNRIILSAAGLAFSLLCIVSCNSDDGVTDAINPELSDFIDAISTAPGLEFKFEGTITDETGIQSIKIYYPQWFLNKVIVLNEKPKGFALDYKFLVPKDAIPGSSHTIKISITDLGGNIVNMDVLVTLDFDIINPVLSFTNPSEGAFYKTGEPMPLNITVSDNLSLQSLEVKSDILNLDDVITFTAGETEYNYSKDIEVPIGLDGIVTIDAIVKDKQGNEISSTVTVIVGANLVFSNVYLIGGSLWYGSDTTKATRMWKDPNDDNWFVGEFYYRTNEDFRFIGQLGLSPYNWGFDPNNSSQIINSQNSLDIGFPDGEGYYRVRFNPYTREYNYQKMTVNVAVKDNMYVVGKGYVGYGLNWNPSDAIAMQRDSSNPYVFSVDLAFSNEVDLKFIGQKDWSPFNCGFVVGGEAQLPINYVKNVLGDSSADIKFRVQAGNYRITFDYFLLRTTIQPIE